MTSTAHDVETAPACDMADGCGAAAGETCEPGCPSLASDAGAVPCELGPIVRRTTADPRDCDQAATTTVRTLGDEATPACGTHAARYRTDCGIEQPVVPPAVGAAVAGVGASALVGRGVYCWRCWAGLIVRVDGSHVAPGEQRDACPAPAAAGGAHVPTTAGRPVDALDVEAL